MSKSGKIKAAIAYTGANQSKVSEDIGMSPQNFSQKLKRDTFSDEELEAIAKAIGAEFQPCAFVFADGTKI